MRWRMTWALTRMPRLRRCEARGVVQYCRAVGAMTGDLFLESLPWPAPEGHEESWIAERSQGGITTGTWLSLSASCHAADSLQLRRYIFSTG